MSQRRSSKSDNSYYRSHYKWSPGLHIKDSHLDHKGFFDEKNEKQINLVQFLEASHSESFQCRCGYQDKLMTPQENCNGISKSGDKRQKEVFLPQTSLETLMAFSRMNNLNDCAESSEDIMSNSNGDDKLWFKIKRRLSLNTK